MNLDSAEDRSAAAGEYVLGTLDAGERTRFDDQLAVDPALQAEVYAWQDRLIGLAGRVPAAQPDAMSWQRIEMRIAQAGGATDRSTRTAAVPLPTPSPSPSPAAPASSSVAPTSRPGSPPAGRAAAPGRSGVDGVESSSPPRDAANDPLWRRLRIWQAIGGLAMAASVLLATLLVMRPAEDPSAARYVAVLQSPDKSAGWLVEARIGGPVRLVPIGTSPPVPPGKALQFWTKAQGATAPTSLGLVRPGEVTELPAARLPTLEAQQLFELTLEPETGSPIGRPTGPVLFVGRTVRS